MDHSDEKFSMIEECTDLYCVEEKPDGIRVVIDIPMRFKWLWLTKLTDLETDKKEIEEYSGEKPT